MEVIGALNDLHRFIGESLGIGIDGIDEVGARGIQIAMPERIITEADDVEVHASVDEFVVVILGVAYFIRMVGMDDDLRLRAFFAHGIATRLDEMNKTRPVGITGRIVIR